MATANLSDEGRQELLERIQSFDLDDRGELDFATLAQISARDGTFLDRLLAAVLIRTYDLNENNTIDFDEFVGFCEHVDLRSEIQLLLQIFKLADLDNSGTLEVDEVRAIADSLNS
jgi:Ca2+-binding EF-hand superfamily protein